MIEATQTSVGRYVMTRVCDCVNVLHWLAISYIIVLKYSVNMPTICKSDGDTPRLKQKRSIRMKVKVEIEKQSDM